MYLAAYHISATSSGCSLVNLCTTRLLQTSTWPKPRQQDLRDLHMQHLRHDAMHAVLQEIPKLPYT